MNNTCATCKSCQKVSRWNSVGKKSKIYFCKKIKVFEGIELPRLFCCNRYQEITKNSE